MKLTYIIGMLLGLACISSTSHAQTEGQLAITSYDKTQPYYFCDGQGQTTGQNIMFALVNLVPSVDIVVDSFHYVCDRDVFDVSGIDTMTNLDVGAVTTQVAYYTPLKEGADTLVIVAFYHGFTSTGTIVCHAVTAPPISFYGVENVSQDIGFGVELGVSDEVLTVDTLHDVFSNMMVSDTPVDVRRYNLNTQIVVRACGSRIIDRMYRVGDSSEVQIQGIPHLPFTMHSGESLVMRFTVRPQIPGKTPHYFVIHTTDDDYLVWSFEYKVFANGGARVFDSPSEILQAVVFPNPVRDRSVAIEVVSPFREKVHLSIVALTGQRELDLGTREIQPGANQLELLDLEVVNGTYLLLIESEHGAIARKVVVAR